MKLAFLLGSPDISGGTYVIFEHATRLLRRGCEVSIICEEEVSPDRYSWHPDASGLRWLSFADIDRNESFDFGIATWWQSVHRLPEISCRRGVYFIQSIESRFFPPKDPENPALRDIDLLADWCENTYRLNIPVITEATWIQEYLRNHYNHQSNLVPNGIRKDIYHPDGNPVDPRPQHGLRVLVEGPLGVFFKNVENTIRLCREAGADEIWLLTSSDITSWPGVDRCFSRVPILETAAIYRSCDVLVKLSYVEGMFGPPLEMFHCGGTAIVYDVTGHDEYIRHGENGIVVARDDEASVVDWIRKLKEDRKLLSQLKEKALKTASEWPDWEEAASMFHDTLLEIHQNTPELPDGFIAEHNTYMLRIREDRLAARQMRRLADRESGSNEPAPETANAIQVYFDCGRGIEKELSTGYRSGTWQKCCIRCVPIAPFMVLRVDPSVRTGIVEIRKIQIRGGSGTLYQCWNTPRKLQTIGVAGTARTITVTPHLVLLAYGEDPQLFLPGIEDLGISEPLLIEIEVKESGLYEHLRKQYLTSGIPLHQKILRRLGACFRKN